MTPLTSTCSRCGTAITLLPSGQHFKWLDSRENWRCGNDPDHPVLAHRPTPDTTPATTGNP